MNITNYKKITGQELDWLRDNFISLFDAAIFPYKKDKVEFYRLKEFGRERIGVAYRNRSGHLQIDNGYYGRTEDKRDYYTILLVNPHFTNVHSAYARTYKTTWDKHMLDDLAKNIIKSWDHAIEKGYTMYG